MFRGLKTFLGILILAPVFTATVLLALLCSLVFDLVRPRSPASYRPRR